MYTHKMYDVCSLFREDISLRFTILMSHNHIVHGNINDYSRYSVFYKYIEGYIYSFVFAYTL